jgi:hypothetical protein
LELTPSLLLIVSVVASGLFDPSSAKGSYLSISFGWGIAVMMAVYVAGGELFLQLKRLSLLTLEISSLPQE